MCIERMHWCTNARMPSQYIALFYCVRRSEPHLKKIDDEPSESIIMYEMHHFVSSNRINNSSKMGCQCGKVCCIRWKSHVSIAFNIAVEPSSWLLVWLTLQRENILWCVQQTNKKGIDKVEEERREKTHGETKPHSAIPNEYVPI